MNHHIVSLHALHAAGTRRKLSFQVAYGAYDTVLVFGQSTNQYRADHLLTSSILYGSQATFQGFESALQSQWGLSAENQLAEQPVSKNFNGNTFQKQWNYGIAALGNTAIGLPGSNVAPKLLFKAWFSTNGSNNFYVEDLTESDFMNEVTTGATATPLSYFVEVPGNQLPVELLGFEAFSEAQTVQLSWTTSQEYNNAGFEVERGTRSREFDAIAWVSSQGNTARGHQYAFVDAEVVAGQTYYYRLRQQDINGEFSYSKTVEVTVMQDGLLSISNCFPNPAKGFTELRLAAEESGQLNWNLYDAMGHRLKAGSSMLMAGNTERLRIGLDGLAPGNYLLQLRTDNQLITRKLSVQ
ncbi:MAG: T9SS type A sorting domain-containing protein [Bacteroidia bacterium]